MAEQHDETNHSCSCEACFNEKTEQCPEDQVAIEQERLTTEEDPDLEAFIVRGAEPLNNTDKSRPAIPMCPLCGARCKSFVYAPQVGGGDAFLGDYTCNSHVVAHRVEGTTHIQIQMGQGCFTAVEALAG